jgi:hypothetical protein
VVFTASRKSSYDKYTGELAVKTSAYWSIHELNPKNKIISENIFLTVFMMLKFLIEDDA